MAAMEVMMTRLMVGILSAVVRMPRVPQRAGLMVVPSKSSVFDPYGCVQCITC